MHYTRRLPLSSRPVSIVRAIDEPREFPLRPQAAATANPQWQAWAAASLAAATGQEREAADAALRGALADALRAERIAEIRDNLDAAGSAALYRHLWRMLDAAWRDTGAGTAAAVIAHGFALPVVIVAAADTAIEVPGILGDTQDIADLLREHRALAGNRNFGLANVLAGAEALGLDRLPAWIAGRDTADSAVAFRDVAPAPLHTVPGQEGAHLRFLIGSALAAPQAALFADRTVGGWGMPLAGMLSKRLAVAGVQLLALPRPPADPLSALQQGRLAHREVALQLFASNALRRLRADFGEPTAVVSAHRVEGGGELRLSLSSPFGERDAQGFRCPLLPYDRVEDVQAMIVDLLQACRVMDVRTLAGTYPDRDPRTGLPLLFRADAIEAAASVARH